MSIDSRPTVSHGCQMMLALETAALLLIFHTPDERSADELQIWLVDDRSAKMSLPGREELFNESYGGLYPGQSGNNSR